jgi:hypothetical protein
MRTLIDLVDNMRAVASNKKLSAGSDATKERKLAPKHRCKRKRKRWKGTLEKQNEGEKKLNLIKYKGKSCFVVSH